MTVLHSFHSALHSSCGITLFTVRPIAARCDMQIDAMLWIYIKLYKHPNSVPIHKGRRWGQRQWWVRAKHSSYMYLSFRTVSPSSEHRERLCSRSTWKSTANKTECSTVTLCSQLVSCLTNGSRQLGWLCSYTKSVLANHSHFLWH